MSMKFQFMAGFREKEGDEDVSSKYLRMLRAAYGGAICGSLWLVLSTSGALNGNQSPDAGLGSVLFISIAMFLFFGSYKAGEFLSTPLRKPYLAASLIVLALVVAEAATLLGWWDLSEMLGSWRKSLAILAGACLVLWSGERAVRIRRSKPRSV